MIANESSPTTPTSTKAAHPAHELTITRIFDAPRELVWRAWTEPALVKQWKGPHGFEVTHYDAGTTERSPWSLKMQGKRFNDGQFVHLGQAGTILTFDPPLLLIYTFAWDDRSAVGLGDSPYKENIVTMKLEDLGDKTLMHFTQTPFATEGERDGHNGGWSSSFDRFAAFLLAQQPAPPPAPPAPTEPTK